MPLYDVDIIVRKSIAIGSVLPTGYAPPALRVWGTLFLWLPLRLAIHSFFSFIYLFRDIDTMSSTLIIIMMMRKFV